MYTEKNVKPIVTDYEQLSEIADTVDTIKDNKTVQKIIKELRATVKAHNLSDLSAPQIGYNKRIFVINYNGDIVSYINPAIQTAEGLDLARETCISIPGKMYIRPRNTKIHVNYVNPTGKLETKELVGATAFVFQHALDHLNGLLVSDVGLEIDNDFLDASEEERLEVINEYVEILGIKHKQIHEDIEKDWDAKQIYGAIDFIDSVRKGETKLLKKDG